METPAEATAAADVPPEPTTAPPPAEGVQVSIFVPLDAEADYWQTVSAGGRVILLMRSGGANGPIVGCLRMEPSAIMRMMSSAMKLAHAINPQIPFISFG